MNPALIGAGAQLGATLIGAGFQGIQNRKARRWQERMYERQMRDSIALWTMQNEYNSPAAQMERFKAAGLNPNLIYGRGSSGLAGNIPTPSAPHGKFDPPDLSGLSGLAGYFDMEIKHAQADNLRTQNTVLYEEAMLKEAQRKRIDYDLGFDTELRSVYADAKRENLRQMKASTRYTLDKNEREAAMNAAGLLESATRVLEIKQRTATSKLEAKRIGQVIRSIQKDVRLKQLDIDWREKGITPSDPLYMRFLGRLLESYDFNFRN